MTRDFIEDLAESCTNEGRGVLIVHEDNGLMGITFRNFQQLTPKGDGNVDELLQHIRDLLEEYYG